MAKKTKHTKNHKEANAVFANDSKKIRLKYFHAGILQIQPVSTAQGSAQMQV